MHQRSCLQHIHTYTEPEEICACKREIVCFRRKVDTTKLSLWIGGISHILIQLYNLNALICTSYIESRLLVCSS